MAPPWMLALAEAAEEVEQWAEQTPGQAPLPTRTVWPCYPIHSATSASR